MFFLKKPSYLVFGEVEIFISHILLSWKKKMKTLIKSKIINGQKGFSLPELLVVLLILAILVVLALPQVISSRRHFRFSGMQRQIAASLSDARQESMSQRQAVTFRYDDAVKQAIIYGGSFGVLGDAKNRSIVLADSGIEPDELTYGRPGGAQTSALSDTSNLTPLTGNAVEIKFQPDGSVVDAADIPKSHAVFFYHNKYPDDMAFAISVLGAGGRIKVWRYNKNLQLYVE